MLRPTDIPCLLSLRVHPRDSYGEMAARLGISKSTAHGSVMRLVQNRLAHHSRQQLAIVADGPALDLLCYGVPYAFAPDTVPEARGVATGLRALMNVAGYDTFSAALSLVWPSKLGEARGVGVTPLVAAAPEISYRDPVLYHMLAIVDALRMGDAREREFARKAMHRAFKDLGA